MIWLKITHPSKGFYVPSVLSTLFVLNIFYSLSPCFPETSVAHILAHLMVSHRSRLVSYFFSFILNIFTIVPSKSLNFLTFSLLLIPVHCSFHMLNFSPPFISYQPLEFFFIGIELIYKLH